MNYKFTSAIFHCPNMANIKKGIYTYVWNILEKLINKNVIYPIEVWNKTYRDNSRQAYYRENFNHI